MKRLILYTKKYFIHIITATVSSVGASVATVLVIDLLRQIIDKVASGSIKEDLPVILLEIIAVILLGMLFNYLVVATTGTIGSELLKNLRNDSLQSILKVSPDFMNKHNFGDIMERMSSDIESLAGFMQEYFKDCLYVPVIVLVYSTYLLCMKPLLAVICLVPLAVLVPVSVKCLKPIKLRQFEYEKELGLTNNNIQEAFDGVEVIKSYNLQEMMEEKYYKALKRTLDISNDTDLRQYNIEPVSAMIREVPLAIALCLGGFMVFSGDITMGVLIAFISTIKKLIEPLAYAYQLVVRSQTAMVCIDRVFYIMDMPEEVQAAKKEFEGSSGGTLIFENVSFAYSTNADNDEKSARNSTIKNIGFTIEKGSKTALVGKSGSGKSTVLKLISRQLEIDAGNINYNGLNYSDMSPDSVRKDMALISQESVLFPMSIFDNIRIGNPDATKEQVMEALKQAECTEFISKMPDGIYSVIDERGGNLSGGQKQRIAIARAIVKNAPVLLLDEPTSALDRKTAKHINETINGISSGKTVITVAHNLDAIKDYDNIIVIDNGMIAEQGKHDELMKRCGEYYKMYREYETSECESLEREA